jgi:DNA-binding PadR family transcriptional regulator
MFYHVLLGFLRDGRPRHAYELISQYRGYSTRPVNAGNVYRECSKLVSQQLIVTDPNPPDADPRRIPYRITQNGCRDFDAWLADPASDEGAFGAWVIFADMLPPAERLRLIDRMQEQLWMDNKALVQARERVLARGRRLGVRRYRPEAFLLLRRIKHTTADLELLEELRRELEQVPTR